MKQILLILVGGTICTAVNEKGSLSVHANSGVLLTENFHKSDSPFAGNVSFHLSRNLYLLSENMTVSRWNEILSLYREERKTGSFDGVIFLHGTDTLAYSSALFSQILANEEKPVFFVSANAPLHSKRSNGNANFRFAVECICREIPAGVYVPYQNISDGKMLLHKASRLKQCPDYSEDFHSDGELCFTDFDSLFQSLPKEKGKEIPFDPMGDWGLKENVLMLLPYVGLRYDVIDLSSYQAVLCGAYHSGTVCVEENLPHSILTLLQNDRENFDVYVFPSKPQGETYDTLQKAAEFRTQEGKGLNFLYGMTLECAYAKLLLAYSLFSDRKARRAFLEEEWNGEFFLERG